MKDFQVIEEKQEQRHNTLQKKSTEFEHKIEKKLIKTVGNIKRNGAQLTTTATISSAKISLTSNTVGKSVASALCMSLERKDFIHYMPRKITPYTISTGQSTVIHLDNYTHFTAHRITTTKAAFRKADIVSGDQYNNIAPCSTKNSSKDIVDGDLNVNGVDSLYHSNKNMNMNKQKMQDTTPATTSRVRGRKALDCKKTKELKIKLKKDISDTSTPIKKPRRKKIIKPRQPRKTQMNTKSNTVQDTVNEESDNQNDKPEKSQISPFITTRSENKLLRPCTYTLQSKKCVNEMTCSYLHSDFPCKYYYLNIPCPQDFNCQFMHNGPLEPKLKEALRNHILDLLSTKPSLVETYFVQQIHNIDDLSHRLQSFQILQDQNNEIIEVMDDADEDHVLVIDESNADVCGINNTSNTNTLSNISIESDKLSSPQYTIHKLDMIYEKFKETNFAVDEIDKKFKSLKTTSNITPNEKIHQLQIIYDLLKEQEKRLQIYENATSTTQMNIDENKNNFTLTVSPENALIEKPNIVLVDPNIINNVVNLESQENVANTSDEENFTAVNKGDAFNTNLPVVETTEILVNDEENLVILTDDENEQVSTNSNLIQIGTENKEESVEENTSSNEPQKSGIEFINTEELPIIDFNGKHKMRTHFKDGEVTNFNLPDDKEYNREALKSVDSTDLTEQCAPTDHTNGDIENRNALFEKETSNEISSPKTLENNSEIAGDKSLELLDKNKMMSLIDIIIPSEKIGELEINNEEKVIENDKEKETSIQEIEEQSPDYEKISPSKPVKGSRIRLRSHRMEDNEEINKIVCVSPSADIDVDHTKPVRTRRLRLPKPSQKPAENSIVDESEIKADVTNKLTKYSKNTSKETENPVQDVEIPLTQNVVLSKRFLKKVQAKLDQQPQLIETKNQKIFKANQNVPALHSNDNKNSNEIENIDVSLLTQTSNDNYSSDKLQDSLIAEGDFEQTGNKSSDVSYSSESYDNLVEIEKIQTLRKPHLTRHISFANPSSTHAATPSAFIKQKYNLGNPQVLIAKLKTPFLLEMPQNDVQADSTTSYANPTVTSSYSSLLADDKLAQKRRSLTDETDLDSSLKENKCLKLTNSQSVRKIHIDKREIKPQYESASENDVDFETDSSDEKLTVTSSCNSIQQQEDFQSSATREEKHHKQHTHLEHEHKEQTENESDLRQQIENVSNKSDLQLQIQRQQEKQQQQQQQRIQQQEEVEKISKTIAKNSNNLPHKQYKQQENVIVMTAAKETEKDLVNQKQYDEESKCKGMEKANTCNSYDNTEKDEDGRTQSLVFKCIYEPEKLASNSSNKYSNEISVMEEKLNVTYSTYSTLFNKLANNTTKRQINFENSSVNITPISSPTYGNDDDTIASPSPVRKLYDCRMGSEIDGRLTYPPIPYILYEIDFGKIDINKPVQIDKLKRTIQLDPRVFRTHIKLQRQPGILCKPTEIASKALVPIIPSTSNNFKLSHDSSSVMHSTSSLNSSYDPRTRSSTIMADIGTPTLPQQTVVTPYNSLQTTVVPSSSASFMQTGIPLTLQYHSTPQPIIAPQQQQTSNMFLYGCLQRSPWYQSLMSTMKIQINQSISQLVRALNNFHRERIFNPEMMFDVFKIDCAGELLEIMRNLGIFIDANGIINEKRHMPSFAGRACCNPVPVNATYSFIQQYLTPNTHCSSLTAAATYSADSGANSQCHLNANEPFVSCYVRAPEPPQRHSHDCCSAAQHSHNDDNHCKRNCNKRCDDSCSDKNNRYDNNNNNSNNNNNNNNNNYSDRRYSKPFKKPYDNNDNKNNYQQRSGQRPSYNNYNNNPRFMKPGACSPTKSNSSPSDSPKRGFDGGSGGSYGGRGGRGGGGGGRFNNNKRFNSYNKDNSNSDWLSSGSNDNQYNNNFQNSSNSPPRNSSPILSSSRPAEPKMSPKAQNSEEECWD